MINSKFNKLFNVIMQWAKDYDIDGRIAFKSSEISKNNQEFPALENGNQVVDFQGNPVYWEVMAPSQKGFDKITGKKFAPNSCIALSYSKAPRGTRGLSNTRVYVLKSTYEDAYANNDEETIAKLQAMGLKPGFDFGVSNY